MQLLALLAAASLLGTGAADKVKITDLKVGKGAAVKNGDCLVVLYKGTFTNGKVFDQNDKTLPFVLELGHSGVIKGWHQGLVGMKAGGKRKLVIPPSLAYGSKERGPIPANSTLIFEVELLSVPKVKVTTLKAGKGTAANRGDSIKVHYRGTFESGKVFDSSYDRKEPFPVTIGEGTIIGFYKGLIGIKPGEKRKVWIPWELAYGANGTPDGTIKPKTNLVFELEYVR